MFCFPTKTRKKTLTINDHPFQIFAKLILNSTQLQLQLWGWDSLIPSYPSHPPTHRESSKMEQDFKNFNWRLQILQLKTSNTSIEEFKYLPSSVSTQIQLQLSLNSTQSQLNLNTNYWAWHYSAQLVLHIWSGYLRLQEC